MRFFSAKPLLVAALTFAGLLTAYDLKEEKEPQGGLKIRLDYDVATKWPKEAKGRDGEESNKAPRNWLFSSHINYLKSVSEITDGQLWQLAFDAYREMEDECAAYAIGKKSIPGVMTILAVGEEIFLSSSQKGVDYTYKMAQDTPVRQSLEMCRLVWRDQGQEAQDEHKNKGSCGEPMVAQQYYSIHEKPLKERDPKPRVGTVGRRGRDYIRLDPCGTAPEEVSEPRQPICAASWFSVFC